MTHSASDSGPDAAALGIAEGFFDIAGTWHDAPTATISSARDVLAAHAGGGPTWAVAAGSEPSLLGPCRLVLEDGSEIGPVHALPPDLPIGYHDLHPLDGGPATFLIVHPQTAPPTPHAWGVAAQLYSLRSEGTQGIGDLADLAVLMRWLDRHGGGAVLLSPLHAPAPTFPQQDSPYYPSSRLWWNPLHLRVPGAPVDEGRTFIDRDTVWRAKRAALEGWFLTSSSGGGWQRWVDDQGPSLLRFARWCALADGHGADWSRWPRELRHPEAPGVQALDLHDPDVQFHAWCQWLFGRQLAEARRGTPNVDVIGDLAVGFDPRGADAWAFQDTLALGWRIGAPPDDFNTSGQEWGLPPFVPSALRAARYLPFRETVRAALRGVSGLRVDHIMGLFRQWWIPPGGGPRDGTYVDFPAADLLAVLLVEAHRAGAFLIGEDLGTVPPGVREAMAAHGVLTTKVAWFEDDPPERWPEECLATLTTHDLPTVAGVWQGRDGVPAMRARLAALTGCAAAALSDEVLVAAHRALATAPARLRLATMEDLCGETARPNVPGTVAEQPNWRRRVALRVDDLDRRATARAIVAALAL